MDGEERILPNVEDWLQQYLGTKGWNGTDGGQKTMMEWGRLSLGLQIETRRRVIATAVGNSMLHLSKEEIVSVLTTVLVDAGLYEDVQHWYERLCDWRESRQVRFVPITETDGVFDRSAEPSVPEAPSESGPLREGTEQ